VDGSSDGLLRSDELMRHRKTLQAQKNRPPPNDQFSHKVSLKQTITFSAFKPESFETKEIYDVVKLEYKSYSAQISSY
jgi:hypothetical protein